LAKIHADPFANATKQLNDACDILGIKDKGIREYLAMPNKMMRVKIPVRMDNGQIRIFTGFRSQHNNDRGPYKGDTLILKAVLNIWKEKSWHFLHG